MNCNNNSVGKTTLEAPVISDVISYLMKWELFGAQWRKMLIKPAFTGLEAQGCSQRAVV